MLPRGIDVYHALVWGSRDALKFGLIVAIISVVNSLGGKLVNVFTNVSTDLGSAGK